MKVHHNSVAVWLVVLCLLRGCRTMPNPDFGINANVSPTKGEVLVETSRTIDELNQIDDVVIMLSGDYTLLTNVQAAIITIGSQFQSQGLNLMGLVETLTSSNGPSISNVFNPVYSAIEQLDNLMEQGLNGAMGSLNSLAGPTISQKFEAAFREVRRSLSQFEDAIHDLEEEVRAARSAVPGSGPIPTSVVRNKVKSKTLSDVVRALKSLRARVPAVRFVVHSTLTYLLEAEEFLLDLESEVQRTFANFAETIGSFRSTVNDLKQETVSNVQHTVTCRFNEQNNLLTEDLPSLGDISTFASALQTPLEGVLAVLDSDALDTFVMQVNGAIDSYLEQAVAVTAELEQFLLDNTCQVVKAVVLLLISFGPNNIYCFSRYASRVFNLYSLHTDSVRECYVSETVRLHKMVQFLEGIVDVVLFDIEDLAHNLHVCIEVSENPEACVTTLGSFYSTLRAMLSVKVSLFHEVLAEDLAASTTRLAACVESAQYATLNDLHELRHGFHRCPQLFTEHEHEHEHEMN